VAGRGPAPKPPGERAGRHKPERGDWQDLPTLEKPVLPRYLPKTKGVTWSARTKRLYKGWRADPVTATYGENEIAQVIELAYLQHHWEETGTGAAEIRQRMDGLGLTPKGKRDLRFGQGVLRRPTQPAAAPSRRGTSRRRLRAVE
jgi:hypothetical protein